MFKVSFIDDFPITASDIAEETSKYFVLSCIYQYVMEGWPQGGVATRRGGHKEVWKIT